MDKNIQINATDQFFTIIKIPQVLLERFKNLKNPCLDIDGRNWYLFQFYHNEIELILQIYEAEKNETPIPRGYPPFGGKIAWARHLYKYKNIFFSQFVPNFSQIEPNFSQIVPIFPQIVLNFSLIFPRLSQFFPKLS